MKKNLFIVFFLLALALLASCETLKDAGAGPSQQDRGQVSIFLSGPDRTSRNITFNLSAVNIMAEDGTSREIMDSPVNINSLESKGRQVLLGERYFSEGKYTGLRLIVTRANVSIKDRTTDLKLPTEGIEIPFSFTVSKNRNTPLFLKWNADASIKEEQFRPALDIKGQVPELSTLLVYVTNEESDNVSVINRQTGEVVGTILVGKRPKGIAVSSRKDRLKVYVANSGSNSVSVIDPTTNTVENEIPVRFGRGPEGIAVAQISPSEELIFTANYRSNTVSIIDASTYQEIDKVDVGYGPVALAVDPPVEVLIGTRHLTQDEVNQLRNYRMKYLNVYVANKDAKNISVLRIDLQKKSCAEVVSIEVEWNPVSFALDYPGGRVYVANYGSRSLSVLNIMELLRGNRTGPASAIGNVGNSAIGVAADPAIERLYVLKEFPGELMIIRTFFDSFSAVRTTMAPSIIGTVALGNSPGALLQDSESGKLYVVNRGSDNVSVIDKTAYTEERIIPVGKKPYGITMFTY